MKNKKTLVIWAAAFVVLIAGAAVLYGQLSRDAAPDQLEAADEPQVTEEEGQAQEQEKLKAPDFSVYNASGERVGLSDYFGKPIVLNFWASWCGPCQMEMPDFEEVYRERGEEIHFMMVNVTGGRETLESAQEFIAEKGYSFPVFYDTESEAANTYAAYSIPTTYFIDSEGYLAARAIGAIDRESLERGLAMIAD